MSNNIYRIAAVERKIERKHIDIFVCGDDGNIYTAWWDEGCRWSTAREGWRNLGGNNFPPRAAVTAFSRMPLHLDVFVCGNNNHVYTKWWHKGRGWTDTWQDLGGAGPQGNLFAPGTEISAVARLPNKIDLFASATTGNVYKCYWCDDECCGGWSSLVARCGAQWKNLNGQSHRKTAAANVAVLSRNPYSIDVFFSGDKGCVYHKCWNGSGGGWDKHWEVLGGDNLAPGGYVTATARMPDHIDLFSCAIDGCVYTAWWHKGRGWHGNENGKGGLNSWRFRLGGGNFPPGAPVSAISVNRDHLDIGIIDEDGSIHRTWWDGRIGAWKDWKDLGGLSVPGSPIAGLTLSPSSIDLFIARRSGEILTMGAKVSDKETLWDGWKCLGTLQAVAPKTAPSLGPEIHTSGNYPNQTLGTYAKVLDEETESVSNGTSMGDGRLSSSMGQSTLEDQRKRTDKWFKEFLELVISTEIDRDNCSKPLKIAILDSGIDKDNRQFSKEELRRIKEVVSFMDDGSSIDRAGHGTHIAAIILKLTRNVDLYIGKVTTSHKNVGQKEVLKALEHARIRWQVDLISMSFGFEEETGELHDEIELCLNSGIMVFASASNDAGEGSRTYPAKFSRVICVHSATSLGKASHDNPPAEEGEPNFSFVGEQIRPTWLTHVPKDSIVEYKSGTSFATPVAVSIAAFMIAYIEKNWPNCLWVIKPRSPEGIMKIFKSMSIKIDGYDWVSPRRHIRHVNKEKIIGDLKQELGCRKGDNQGDRKS